MGRCAPVVRQRGVLGKPLSELRFTRSDKPRRTNPRAMCTATTKAGRPCRKRAVDDGLCLFHSGKLDLAELGRRGGKARGRRKEQGAAELEQLARFAGGG